jgi:plasmid stability protein
LPLPCYPKPPPSDAGIAVNGSIPYARAHHRPEMAPMATLAIGNLSNEDHKALRVRAAHHGVSMEAEARAILHAALREQPQTSPVRRSPPKSAARKGKTLGDLVSPLVDETDWECLK